MKTVATLSGVSGLSALPLVVEDLGHIPEPAPTLRLKMEAKHVRNRTLDQPRNQKSVIPRNVVSY